MLKIRMARAGTRNLPFFHIVLADSRSPRDGKFIEKLGTYNPKLPRENPQRVTLQSERILHWVSKGAQVTDRVAIFLGKAGVMPMPERKNNPQKSVAKAKMTDRAKKKAEKSAAPAAPAEAAAE
jgi:small subunit ribosomal protein S16